MALARSLAQHTLTLGHFWHLDIFQPAYIFSVCPFSVISLSERSHHWPSGKASASKSTDLGSNPALPLVFFRVESYQWLKTWCSSGYCQVQGTIGSVLGLVGPECILWQEEIVWCASSIPVWQHVQLSEQIHSWDTLACCWDVKQPTNNFSEYYCAGWSPWCTESVTYFQAYNRTGRIFQAWTHLFACTHSCQGFFISWFFSLKSS